MQPPKIDPRTYEEIIAQAEALAQAASGWQPQPAGDLDAGGTLIRIFSHYAEQIINRLNHAPDKAFLAFLNLIGAQITPPQPARVPLTFQLAAGSPVDALVPARTQAAAPPQEGGEEEVIFETEQELLVTRAQLVQVVARNFAARDDADRYGRYTANALGQIDAPFPVFAGNKNMVHALYLAADALLNLEKASDVTFHFTGPNMNRLHRLPLAWAYLQEEKWHDIASENVQPGVASDNSWPVTLKQLPPLAAGEVNGVKGGWLRLQLALPLPPPRVDIMPEAIATGAANPVAYAPPFYPFGADGRALYFYLNGEAAFARRGATVLLDVTLATAGMSQNITLQWDYLRVAADGSTSWAPLDALNDGTAALTQDGRISLLVPSDGSWGVGLHRSASGRWLRASIVDGAYTQTPQIQDMRATEMWHLPEINQVHLSLPQTRPPLLANTGFTNSLALDMSKDFYPFGEEPRFNDVFYLAYGIALQTGGVKPGDLIILNITLGAAGKAGSQGVTLAWEFWNGRTWEQLGHSSNTNGQVEPSSANFRDDTHAFTDQPASGGVQFTLPATAAASVANGVEDYWLRVRIIAGNYGVAAGYQAYDINISGQSLTAYRLLDASYRPPLITSLRFDVSNTTRFDLAASLSYNDFTYVDQTEANATPGALFAPFVPTTDRQPALYLGFDQPFDNRSVTLYAQVEPPPPEAVIPAIFEAVADNRPLQVSWEYNSAQGWSRLGAVDETNAFQGRGLIRFIGPKGFTRRTLFGHNLYWLRVRWQDGRFPALPRLRRLLTNTTWARQAVTIRDEIVGSSDGTPAQQFQLAQTNILMGEEITVREPPMSLTGTQATAVYDFMGNMSEIWVRWLAVPDFHGSGPGDRHYLIDRITGTVLFGNGQYGLIPPIGQNNIRASYRNGGGERGNRKAGAIIALKSSIAYVDSVTNVEAAAGGAERQSLDNVRRYGPRQLRHRYRAVTASDLEDLAFAASARVARAKAIPPRFNPLNLWLPTGETPTDLTQHQDITEAGTVGLIIVPQSDSPRPVPSLDLLAQVKEYLVAHCTPTADVWVAGPEWIEVSVTAVIVPVSLAAADFMSEAVAAALARFLHPLTGGPAGKGWAFGRKPYRSDLYALIEGVAGVDHVHTLTVTELPDSATISRLERRLIFSGRHNIAVTV